MSEHERVAAGFRALAAEFARQAMVEIKQAREGQKKEKVMEKKNNGIKVGQKVTAKLNDGKDTQVTGKVLKVNCKGKAVVEVEGRGKCIIPLHSITPAAPVKPAQDKAPKAEQTKAPAKKAPAKKTAPKAA